jgi:hypothetical protein
LEHKHILQYGEIASGNSPNISRYSWPQPKNPIPEGHVKKKVKKRKITVNFNKSASISNHRHVSRLQQKLCIRHQIMLKTGIKATRKTMH